MLHSALNLPYPVPSSEKNSGKFDFQKAEFPWGGQTAQNSSFDSCTTYREFKDKILSNQTSLLRYQLYELHLSLEIVFSVTVLESENFFAFATTTSPIMQLVCPPPSPPHPFPSNKNICITIVFNCYWDDCNS